MSHAFFTGESHPRIFAHRGFVSPEAAAIGIHENSRAAVAAALLAGTQYVESDCQLTRDGRVVLFHDSTLQRTLGDPRGIASVTFDELAELMAPAGGLLSLEDAIAEFPTARFNIDMKSRAVAGPAGEIVGGLAQTRVLIGGFSDAVRIRSLDAARRFGATPATSAGQSVVVRVLGALALRSQRQLDLALSGVDALQIPERQGPVPVLTDRLIAAAHARGVEVHVWTVNDPVRMRELVARGVDGVVTDRTDLAVAALAG